MSGVPTGRMPLLFAGRGVPPNPRRSIPMALLSEEMAQRNHGQTLSRLRERGGVDPQEAYAMHFGLRFQDSNKEKADAWIAEFVSTESVP